MKASRFPLMENRLAREVDEGRLLVFCASRLSELTHQRVSATGVPTPADVTAFPYLSECWGPSACVKRRSGYSTEDAQKAEYLQEATSKLAYEKQSII